MASLEIGRTFTRMGTLVGNSFGSVGMFVATIRIMTAVGLFFIVRLWTPALLATASDKHNSDHGSAMSGAPWLWVLIAITLLAGVFSMAGATGGMLRLASGNRVTIRECTTIASKKFASVLWLSVLGGSALTIVALFFVIPAGILLSMWAVAVPVLVANEAGVLEAFRRSRALTKGSRWKVLFLVVVIGGLACLISFVLGLAGSKVISGFSSAATQAAVWPIVRLFQLLADTVLTLVINALMVSIYIELGGEGTSHLANVFA